VVVAEKSQLEFLKQVGCAIFGEQLSQVPGLGDLYVIKKKSCCRPTRVGLQDTRNDEPTGLKSRAIGVSSP